MKIRSVFAAMLVTTTLLVMAGCDDKSKKPPTQKQVAAVTCESDFGTKVPVLMVHGFNSNPGMWTDGLQPMDAVIRGIGDVKVVKPFNYSVDHFEWVTHPNIGPKLAATIDCLAAASRKNGGAGKVIVIAHSMGGLAARAATNQTVDGRKVADETGLVITIATPHLGSLWGNAGTEVGTAMCQGAVGTLTMNPLLGLLMTKEECLANLAIKGLSKDSRELRELPHFPASVSVRAIAGDARVYVQAGLTDFAKTGTKSDLVVGVDSATAEYTKTGRGDGRFLFGCDVRRYESTNKWQGGQCTHNELPKTNYIQESVRKGIEEYLASTQPGGACLSLEKANELLVAEIPDVGLRLDRVLCERDAAYGDASRADGIVLFVRQEGGEWTFFSIGSDFTQSTACVVMPPGIVERLSGCPD